ncbi:MAG: chloride channel protein [Deltaproteobacteria bacterium]|nr:chloride channel protein [Deltaproteobacteria bacterium]
MAPALAELHLPTRGAVIDRRVAVIAGLAIAVAIAAGFVAQLLAALIAIVTNLAFHQRLGLADASPFDHQLGAAVIVVPIIGGVIVGIMARYGSKAIRGHGIPEAMEQVLTNQSRIPRRMTFLKPLSAAVAIGTGGPFGAEGPIIATGGALGSWLGQVVRVSADERKVLLAAGAAAGMAATFGSPVAAVLLAIELLLFEYRARSVIPVALAASAATAVRVALVGAAPVFPLPDVLAPGAVALLVYVAIGGLLGVASVVVTRLVYGIEDAFERLPIHWMWWPAIGGIAVGVVGFLVPRTLGVGYVNIEDTVRGDLVGTTLAVLCGAKLVSWAIALGSGTSGGTLAPLFTIGGALGALVAAGMAQVAPGYAIDPRLGALVGMAAMFAGASRALLASVVFAFECTRQPIGLLPLLAGCAVAYFVSALLMPNSIMTEKLARRGLRVRGDYQVDHLDALAVADHASKALITLDAQTTVAAARAILATAHHQGFPVVEDGALIGVLTRRDLVEPALADDTRVGALVHRAPVVVHPDHSLRDAADHMVTANVGRVVVVTRAEPRVPIGILTRGDLLAAHARRLDARHRR